MKKYLVLLCILLGNRYVFSNEVEILFVNKTSHLVEIGIESSEDRQVPISIDDAFTESVPVGCAVWVMIDGRHKCNTVVQEKTRVITIHKWLGKWFMTQKKRS